MLKFEQQVLGALSDRLGVNGLEAPWGSGAADDSATGLTAQRLDKPGWSADQDDSGWQRLGMGLGPPHHHDLGRLFQRLDQQFQLSYTEGIFSSVEGWRASFRLC